MRPIFVGLFFDKFEPHDIFPLYIHGMLIIIMIHFLYETQMPQDFVLEVRFWARKLAYITVLDSTSCKY